MKRDKNLGYWAKEWLDNKKNSVKDSTYVKYRSTVFVHIIPALGNLSIPYLNNNDLQNFINMKVNKELLSEKTVSEIINILKNILEYAEDFSISNQCKFKYIGIKNKKSKTIRFLTKSEEKILLHILLNNIDIYKLGVLISLYSGLRLGEICALKWKNIDFKENTIFVEHTMQRIQVSNENKKTNIVITSPKTISSYRKVPISSFLIDILKKFKTNDSSFVLSTSEILFVEPRVMQYRFKTYLRQGNIINANFHSLRHTFATRCIESGVEAKALSEMLGHSSVTITLDRYVHSTMEYKQSNINKFDEYMNNLSQS